MVCHSISFDKESRFFDWVNYLLFMSEMYYWGRLRKEGANYKDKYNHSWTLVCQHTYPSQEVPSAGTSELNMWTVSVKHDNTFCAFHWETALWIAALLVFWLNSEFMFDNRWHSDLPRRGSCPWTDDTPPPYSSSVRRPHCETLYCAQRRTQVCRAQCCSSSRPATSSTSGRSSERNGASKAI